MTTLQTITLIEFLHVSTKMIKKSWIISIIVLENISDAIIDWIKATLSNDKLAIDIIFKSMNFPDYLRYSSLIFFEKNRVYIPDQENLH